MDRGIPPRRPQRYTVAGRIPLAVVVVDREGLVSHWSAGARGLFGPAHEDAVGRPADDLLPVSGALVADGEYTAYDSGPGPGVPPAGRTPFPTAGRARLPAPGRARVDVLWWGYPMAGPGAGRLLVLAADAARLGGRTGGTRRIAPGFARHAEVPGARELARGLPRVLPGMTARETGRAVARILDLGYPVVEAGRHGRVAVTPDWSVPRPAGRRGAAGAGPRHALG
ncbi:hypothetical protein [Streptomyces sp. NPDC001889]